MSNISIIGLGNIARTLGAHALAGGHTVEIIGRDEAKATALAKELGGGTTAATIGSAPAGDIVILAEGAPAGAHAVKAFNTLFGHVLAADQIGGRRLDVLIAGDDAQAKARVSAFIDSLALRPLDTGDMKMAR